MLSLPMFPFPDLVQWFLEHFPGELDLQNRALTLAPGWLYGGGSAPESHRIPYSPFTVRQPNPLKHGDFYSKLAKGTSMLLNLDVTTFRVNSNFR